MIHPLTLLVRATSAYLKARLRRITPFDKAQRRFEHGYLVQLLAATRGDLVAAVRISRLNCQELHALFDKHRLDPADYRETSKAGFGIQDSGFARARSADLYSLPL
jgi:DNA-binding NtrC family response regulator